MRHTYFLALLLSVLIPLAHAQQKMTYMIFDGGKYQGEEIKNAVAHPSMQAQAGLSKDNWYVVPRSADGHYYITASLNGFPVVFLVDTGATKTAVGGQIAKNAGIRAGLQVTLSTANGTVAGAQSEGNALWLGPYVMSEVSVVVSTNPQNATMALLGMDVLKRFRMYQSQDALMLQRAN